MVVLIMLIIKEISQYNISKNIEIDKNLKF